MKIEIPKNYFNVLRIAGDAADELGVQCYVVGGFVRDLLCGIDNDDFDFVVVGSGIDLAKHIAEKYGAVLSVFESYGTANVRFENGLELEFVGARREFYHRESRNPIVENGTLDDDLARRDFTINAMAISVNASTFGELIDKYNGQNDLKYRVIRCVGNPGERFDEDALRILRAARFAAKLGFTIDTETLQAMYAKRERMSIITQERITEEINKMLKCRKPSIAFQYLEYADVLRIIFPELDALRICDVKEFVSHKNIFYHTMCVLDNVAAVSNNLYARWAALLHDIAKPYVKEFDIEEKKWTFYFHEKIGAEDYVPRIFEKFKLPLGNELNYVKKLVSYHMRPEQLCGDNVSDASIRRFIVEAGDELNDIIMLSDCDMSTAYKDKIEMYRGKNNKLRARIVELIASDNLANFKIPVDGNDIMRILNIPQGKLIKAFKEAVKNAILDGKIKNNREDAIEYVKSLEEQIKSGC